MDKFYGYAFNKEGAHTGQVPFDDTEDALNWIITQSKLSCWKRVILTDDSDCCVAEIIKGKATFPPELVKAQNEGKF